MHSAVSSRQSAAIQRWVCRVPTGFCSLRSGEIGKFLPPAREVGRPYGLEWAEAFHYIGPVESVLDGYIAEHAVPL